MKNILKNAENAEKLLELTSDTMILLDRNGICVDIAVHNADLWFLKENQLLDRNILQLLPSVTYRQVYPEFKKVLAYKEVSARNYELTIGSETYFFKCIMRPYEDMVLCQYRDITERSQRKRELEKKKPRTQRNTESRSYRKMEIQFRQAMLLLHRTLPCNVH